MLDIRFCVVCLGMVEAHLGIVDIGEGFCSSQKELASGGSIQGCFDQAAADADCANKNTISYGKGSRGKRCLCDKIVNCVITKGLALGANGYDRFQLQARTLHATCELIRAPNKNCQNCFARRVNILVRFVPGSD